MGLLLQWAEAVVFAGEAATWAEGLGEGVILARAGDAAKNLCAWLGEGSKYDSIIEALASDRAG